MPKSAVSSSIIRQREKQVCFALAITTIVIANYLYSEYSSQNGQSPPHYIYGSKSPYYPNSGAETLERTLKSIIPSQCEPIHINTVARHGSRYPTNKILNNFNTLLIKLEKDYKVANFTKSLQKFYERVTFTAPATLSVNGRFEFVQLAQRVCKYFPTLCVGDFKSVKLEATYKSRSYESAFWYLYGMFNSVTHSPSTNLFQSISPENSTLRDVDSRILELKKVVNFKINEPVDDKQLRFFEACNRYESSVINNKTSLVEVEKFERSSLFTSTISAINSSFCTVDGICTLDEHDIKTVYSLCLHSVMLFADNFFCKHFSYQHLDVLVYHRDLKDYWESYRGYAISYESSCFLMTQIINNIKTAVDGHISKMALNKLENQPKSVTEKTFKQFIRVAHGETLLPLLGLLNTVVTDHLTADSFSTYRSFRSGLLIPMGANLMFVVYHCNSQLNPPSRSSSSDNYSDFNVMFLLNEHPLVLNQFKDPANPRAPVPLKRFLEKAKTCDLKQFHQVCSLKSFT